MQVWKYRLNLGDQFISMPLGSKALHVAVQHNQPCLWVQVDPIKLMDNRRILVIGTGHSHPSIQESTPYLGSFMLNDGEYVFHVFQIS